MVTEPEQAAVDGWENCIIGSNIAFKANSLATYFFKHWTTLLDDALLVAGAVEFCDMNAHRPSATWSRHIVLQVPVFDLSKWQQPSVADALHAALNHLTGDRWEISFVKRLGDATPRGQQYFALDYQAEAVIPFSDGLDSCSVAEIAARDLGRGLVRVRLGSGSKDMKARERRSEAFASVPYSVKGNHKEPTMRTRGFKFGVVSGLAAYLAKTNRVILPESGQGVIGPAIATLGQIYSDYRSHPTFLRKLERFLEALLGQKISYELPRLWHTKGETLKAHVDGCDGTTHWQKTHSCWQQNRHAGVNQKRRHCGICAACLLRRMSVHAAGLEEPVEQYIWEDLTVAVFEDGASKHFDRKKITGKMRQYAIAGALHLDHLADFARHSSNKAEFDLQIFQLARACGLSEQATRANLQRLLGQHNKEWLNFVASLGPNSFLRKWITAR